MAKLKVFTWSDGFHAYTVAETSRPKALAAWGFTRDLFKEGAAHEDPDAPDAEAALAAPGKVIERGLTVDVGTVARVQRPAVDRKAAARKKRLTEMKAELKALEEAQALERKALDDEIRALEARRSALSEAQDKTRDRLRARIEAAED